MGPNEEAARSAASAVADARRRRRFQELFNRDDVEFVPGEAKSGYLVRPREILCAVEDATRVLPVIDQFVDTEDRWGDALCGKGKKRSYKPPRYAKTDLASARLVRRYVDPTKFTVPSLIEYTQWTLRKQGDRLSKPQSLSVNHVMLGEQWWAGEPGADPHPIPEDEAMTLGLFGEGGKTEKGASVLVGIIDTGIDARAAAHHPLLRGHFDPKDDDFDVLSGDGDEFLDSQAGHGTFVAGVVRKRAQSSRFDPEAGLSPDGVGDAATICALITDMANRTSDRPHIINLSLGCFTADDQPPPGLAEALAACRANGVVVVAAAGNQDVSRRFYPAAHPGVVGVGALESIDEPLRKAEFSNYGEWVTAWSPGVDVPGLYVVGKWDPSDVIPAGRNREFDRAARWSGTSFAAPLVAGAIADRMAANPGMPATQARDELLAAAQPGPGGQGALVF